MRGLFDGDRATLRDSLEATAESLAAYGQHYPDWALAYSGGKDSSACLTAVVHLLAEGKVPRPRSLTVLYADTRMELPPLHEAAMRTLKVVREKGFEARVVLPSMDDRFMVYMLGRGVPPPSNTFRWCTGQLKVEPMLAALRELRGRGDKLLMLTGVRLGESAARDRRISLSCSRDGGECGQGWFQETTPESVADTLAPLLHWRVCHVWDWLAIHAPRDGFATEVVARVYDADEEGSANEISARTGCVGCNLASRDLALERVASRPEWAYLEPLRRLKPLYAELKRPCHRLRKAGGETRKDGTPASNQGRLGPLTLEARLWGLEQVLQIQREINEAAHRQGSLEYLLIDPDEEARIRELIAAGMWPQKWTGDEPVGDSLPYEIRKDGSVQHWLPGVEG